jgi:hypothetical protein
VYFGLYSGSAGDLTARLKSFGKAAKVCQRHHKFNLLFENNCKFIIDLLDLFEETRALSLDEGSLRATCRSTLERLILARAAHWKQRGKFRAIVEGDENSKFFHARASQRLRRNSNRTLDIGGVADAAHDAKAAALFSYYSNLLGWRPAVQWEFDVNALYSGCPRVNGDALVGAFSPLEIEAAINSLDRASAPGPDGFGPAFYRAIWATAHPALLRLFKNFHSCSVDLERINRSHIVLLPKPAAVVTAASFRPVSLQNCSVKTLCKALTFRLQQQIGALIDVDQTGFLTGWSISENFIATELVQTCYRRKAPTVVLKLDFAKAFDSVSWSSLLRGDARQGFPYALVRLARRHLHLLALGRAPQWRAWPVDSPHERLKAGRPAVALPFPPGRLCAPTACPPGRCPATPSCRRGAMPGVAICR